MNITLDGSIIVTLLVNAVFIVLGILIKNELHDIKSRIVRLEDKLMKALIPIAFALSLITPGYGFSATAVTGGAVYEPGSTEILCQSPKFCPRVVAPDWSTGGSTMYGTDPTCRKSIDGGRNWAACTTQPSATNSNINIAVARNGAVLWAGNDALGTVYNIRRSTNGTTSWATVYSTATTDVSGANGTSRIKCAQTSNRCLAYYVSAGNNFEHLVSEDNGLTWTPGTIAGTALAGYPNFAISLDGTTAIAPPLATNGTSFRGFNYNSGWAQSAVWPTSTGGSCSGPFIVFTFNRALCNDTTLGTNITTREENGVIQNTFNLSARFPGGATVLLAGTPSQFSSRVALVATNGTGSTTVWISADSGNTWAAEGTLTESILAPYDSFSLNNCVYFSYFASGLNGRLTKVCP